MQPPPRPKQPTYDDIVNVQAQVTSADETHRGNIDAIAIYLQRLVNGMEIAEERRQEKTSEHEARFAQQAEAMKQLQALVASSVHTLRDVNGELGVRNVRANARERNELQLRWATLVMVPILLAVIAGLASRSRLPPAPPTPAEAPAHS